MPSHRIISIIIVMGVSGSGKTTVAQALAARLCWVFVEGDHFHSPENIAKMRAGISLTDKDRQPWLKAIAAAIDRNTEIGLRSVVACSALKRAYRDILIRNRNDECFVYLKGSHSVITDRLAARHGHFMAAGLLNTQIEQLEEPQSDEPVIVTDAHASVDHIVDSVIQQLGLTEQKAAS